MIRIEVLANSILGMCLSFASHSRPVLSYTGVCTPRVPFLYDSAQPIRSQYDGWKARGAQSNESSIHRKSVTSLHLLSVSVESVRSMRREGS